MKFYTFSTPKTQIAHHVARCIVYKDARMFGDCFPVPCYIPDLQKTNADSSHCKSHAEKSGEGGSAFRGNPL